jgi:nitrate reductase (NAD(P)H)
VIAQIFCEKDDKTELRVVDANKFEKNILLKEQMEKFQKKHKDQIEICHVLSHPSEEWKGVNGYVNKDISKENAFAPDGGKESMVSLCGCPAMIQKAALLASKDWGYKKKGALDSGFGLL